MLFKFQINLVELTKILLVQPRYFFFIQTKLFYLIFKNVYQGNEINLLTLHLEKNIVYLTKPFCTMNQGFLLNQQKYLFDSTKS